MDPVNIIAVDLGGTKILTALIRNNKIIHRVKIPTDASKGKASIVKDIAQSISQVFEEKKIDEQSVKAICMGVPGTVNPNTGIISKAPNLNIQNYNIKRALQKYFNAPIIIENDVNLGALGIKQFEFKNRTKNMLVVFIGTGIGGALIFDGKLYRGSNYFAGEIGHMHVAVEGHLHGIRKDEDSTLENHASRTAIVREITHKVKKGKKSIVSGAVKQNHKIKSKLLAKALAKDDSLVKKEMKHACSIIGSVLGSLTTLLNFDTIVLGGGVVEASPEFMLEQIRKHFNKTVLEGPGAKVKIQTTALGDDAPLLGGVALAEEFISD